MKEEKYVKDYFKKKGTVAKWWNPTKSDYSYLYEYELNIIKKEISKQNKECALEISCGKGRCTKELNYLFKEYLATDISREMLSIAKKECPNVKFKIEDAEKLSFHSEYFDILFCIAAIVHYPNPQFALNEFYRVLKKKGILILDSDNTRSIRRIVKWIYRFFEKNKNIRGSDIFSTYTRKEIINMVKKAGFKIKKVRYIGLLSPITCHTKNGKEKIIFNEKKARIIHKLKIDNIPILNRLATYHLIIAEKI